MSYLLFGLESLNVAVAISLVIYTLIGLACYFYGLNNEQKAVKIYGGMMVGFVVARLLFVSIWEMSIAGKFTTFFIIGTLLISTAFISKRKKKLNISDNNEIQ